MPEYHGILTAAWLMDTLCRLMQPELPLTIDPKRLAQRGETLSGQYAIRDLPRLEQLLHDRSGTVVFVLEFSFDEVRRLYSARGRIKAEVNVQCQRCLGRMFLIIDNPVFIGVPDDPASEIELPDGCEPMFDAAGPVSLPGLIEDELILAIPIAPMHPAEECKASARIDDMNQKARVSPFSVLKNRLQKTTNRRN